MAAQFVVGLYDSRGYAQDARNRLHTEGVPLSEMAIVVLHDIAPVPEHTRTEELETLSVSPLMLGDVRNTFVDYIKNGETALIVNAPTIVEVDVVTDVMKLFDPLAIEVLTPKIAVETHRVK
jgi:hypothetical protein